MNAILYQKGLGQLSKVVLNQQKQFFYYFMPKTFDYYRSLNNRFVATLDQQYSYDKYLRRIDQIVNKKPQVNSTTSFYMTFLNRCHERSNNHRSQECLTQISSENQILLDKIVKAKRKNTQKAEDKYMLAMHEKRFRQLQKINEENKKIAMRVVQQTATIVNGSYTVSAQKQQKQSHRRIREKTFYQFRVKQRKLPKLIDMRS